MWLRATILDSAVSAHMTKARPHPPSPATYRLKKGNQKGQVTYQSNTASMGRGKINGYYSYSSN